MTISRTFLLLYVFIETTSSANVVITLVTVTIAFLSLVVILIIYKKRQQTSKLANTVEAQHVTVAEQRQNNQVRVS